MILDSTQNILVTSEIILNSTQNILQSYQKSFWIPLKIFYSHVRNDFGFTLFTVICQKWFWIPLKIFYSHSQKLAQNLLSAKQGSA